MYNLNRTLSYITSFIQSRALDPVHGKNGTYHFILLLFLNANDIFNYDTLSTGQIKSANFAKFNAAL